MTRIRIAHGTLVLLLVGSVALAGCSKKTQAPPESAPPAAETPAEAPPTTPPAEDTPSTPSESPSVSWQDAYFDYDSYDLREDARQALDADAKMMRDRAGTSLLIEGHCDERGTPEYNLSLGEKRANAARDYLVAQGVDNGRIETVSFGEERPFATGHDEQSWAQNRRAHLVQK